MSNTINPRPLEPVLKELQEKGFSQATVRLFRDTFTRIDKVLTDKGEVQAQSNVTGRTEQIGTTIQNITATGDLASADHVAADGATFGRVNVGALTSGNVDMSKAGVTNKTTDNLTDGTGSPLTGGKRGFIALSSANRLADSFRNTAVNATNAPTSSTVLSNDGVSTAVTIAASSNQFAAGTVSYNSGSVDPGAFGVSVYVYADDPTFAGGAVTYAQSATPVNQTGSEGRVPFGVIATTGGVAKTGGGYSGGTGGRPGGRGFVL